MLKLLNLLLYGYASCIFGQNCISQQDINNNQYTTYQNKVYDISNYQHPGGQPLLFKAKGKTLEEFFNKEQYKFHIKDVQTKKDLESIYIGDDQLDALSSIKSKEELIGDVLLLLQSPMKSLLSAISAPGRNLAGALKTLSEKE